MNSRNILTLASIILTKIKLKYKISQVYIYKHKKTRLTNLVFFFLGFLLQTKTMFALQKIKY